MMVGYLKLAAVTAASRREGWLQTRDMAAVDAAGCFYIVDRWDDLMMRNGFNRHSREAEAVRPPHPAVREAEVFGTPDSEWGSR